MKMIGRSKIYRQPIQERLKKKKEQEFQPKKNKRIERNKKRNKAKIFLIPKEHKPLDQKDSQSTKQLK